MAKKVKIEKNLFGKKFKNLAPPDESMKKFLVSFLENEVGVEVDKKDISFSGKNIYIRSDSVSKRQILFRQREVIRAFEKKFPQKKDLKIR